MKIIKLTISVVIITALLLCMAGASGVSNLSESVEKSENVTTYNLVPSSYGIGTLLSGGGDRSIFNLELETSTGITNSKNSGYEFQYDSNSDEYYISGRVIPVEGLTSGGNQLRLKDTSFQPITVQQEYFMYFGQSLRVKDSFSNSMIHFNCYDKAGNKTYFYPIRVKGGLVSICNIKVYDIASNNKYNEWLNIDVTITNNTLVAYINGEKVLAKSNINVLSNVGVLDIYRPVCMQINDYDLNCVDIGVTTFKYSNSPIHECFKIEDCGNNKNGICIIPLSIGYHPITSDTFVHLTRIEAKKTNEFSLEDCQKSLQILPINSRATVPKPPDGYTPYYFIDIENLIPVIFE